MLMPMRPRRAGRPGLWKRFGAAGAILASSILGARAQSDEARIVIDAARVEGQIDPRLYGQFVEFMYEGVKGGLSAELLRNRGFEEPANNIGLSRHWERHPDDRNDDYGLSFGWDAEVAYPVSLDLFEEKPVQRSLRVDLTDGIVERHGVYQPRIPVRAGIAYHGYLWLKTTGYDGRIRVALEEDRSGGALYSEAEIKEVRGDWKRYAFELHSQRTDHHARLAILFDGGRGRVWVDQVSLLPGDAVGGVRADVLALVAALRPAFIRWPGGNVAQDYHWAWGVGPRDRRPVWTNLSWKNEPEPGDIGTDEFIAFCRRMGAEPSITVNVEGRGATAEEAAAWVEYCNGPATSRYGAIRAANGHPEPYQVKYWELGNEIWGDWVRGHSDALTYARNYVRYHKAMRAVDSGIQFIAVGDNDMGWNRTVLRTAGGAIDYLAIHHYYGRKEMAGDARNLMARPLRYERLYKDVEKVIREEAPGQRQHQLRVRLQNRPHAALRSFAFESERAGRGQQARFAQYNVGIRVLAAYKTADGLGSSKRGHVRRSQEGLHITQDFGRTRDQPNAHVALGFRAHFGGLQRLQRMPDLAKKCGRHGLPHCSEPRCCRNMTRKSCFHSTPTPIRSI